MRTWCSPDGRASVASDSARIAFIHDLPSCLAQEEESGELRDAFLDLRACPALGMTCPELLEQRRELLLIHVLFYLRFQAAS